MHWINESWCVLFVLKSFKFMHGSCCFALMYLALIWHTQLCYTYDGFLHDHLSPQLIAHALKARDMCMIHCLAKGSMICKPITAMTCFMVGFFSPWLQLLNTLSAFVAMAAAVIPKAAGARPSGAYGNTLSATWMSAPTDYVDGKIWIGVSSLCNTNELSDAENIGCSYVHLFVGLFWPCQARWQPNACTHVCLSRKEIMGRYRKVGERDGECVYRGQAEDNGPFDVKGGIHFLWYGSEQSLWYLTTVPVEDTNSADERSHTDVKLCATEDWSKVWCPWNATTQSKLRIESLVSYYETRLTCWQNWWHADGRNEFMEIPPPSTSAPPSKKAKTDAPQCPAEPAVPPKLLPWAKAFPTLMPPPPPPVPGASSASTPAVPSASSPASTVSQPPHGLHKDSSGVYTGWKPKMCALIVAIKMGLTQRSQYLMNKLLVCKYVPEGFDLIASHTVVVVVVVVVVVGICPTCFASQLRFSENQQMQGMIATHRETIERFGRDPLYDYWWIVLLSDTLVLVQALTFAWITLLKHAMLSICCRSVKSLHGFIHMPFVRAGG